MTKVSRRAFGLFSGLSLVEMALAGNVEGQRTTKTFPDSFVWGVATSAYQIEGAAADDGRGPSIWDVFSHTVGKVRDNATGDIADDHFHLFRQDIALVSGLGVGAYRFSVAWPRIFPAGRGVANPKGLDFYDRIVDELCKFQIKPFCTLYHWDLPSALQESGGWENRDTASAFADYAGHVARRLSDRVKYFMTMNEMRSFIDLGYRDAIGAPGLRLDRRRVAQAAHHAVLAHGLGVKAIRAAAAPDTKVGLADNVEACTPVIESADHIAAAERAMREENARYLTVIMEGRYTDLYLETLGADAPKHMPRDLETIAQPIDFVGLNIYTPSFVRDDPSARGYAMVPRPNSYPHMASRWLTVGPEAMYWAPKLVDALWKGNQIFITENGASAADTLLPNDTVLDVDRIMYLRNYLSQLHRAVTDGAPVKGYFLWSLLDNFEWSDGYKTRFGIYYVNFATQKRIPKLSANFYRSVVRGNRVM